jgi:hypothetical protein
MEQQAAGFVSAAKAYGLDVYIIPFLMWEGWEGGGVEKVPEEHLDNFLEQLNDRAIQWAEFAERNDVEMLTPMCETHLYLGWEGSSQWHQEILPKLREVYSGKLIVAHQNNVDFPTMGEKIPELDYGGYDYAGLSWVLQHVNSWKEAEEAIRKTLDHADHMRGEYDVGIIHSRLGSLGVKAEKLVQGYEDHLGDVKLRLYRMVMEESTDRIDGVFFYAWQYSHKGGAHIYCKRTPEGWRMVDAWQGKEPYYFVKEYFTNPDDKLAEAGYGSLDNSLGISIDGDGEDWRSADPACVDPRGDVFNWEEGAHVGEGPLGKDLKALYAVKDHESLILAIETYNGISGRYKIVLDTDLNGQEDHHVLTDPSGRAGLVGTVYENERPSHYNIGSVPCAYGDVVEVRIPLDMIENPEKLGIRIYSDPGYDAIGDVEVITK